MPDQRLAVPCPNCGHDLAAAEDEGPGRLTPTQLDCARIIHELTEAAGYAPSYEEIGFELGIRHKSGVHRLVLELEKHRWLTRVPHAFRSIKLLAVPPPAHYPAAIEITARGHAALAEGPRELPA